MALAKQTLDIIYGRAFIACLALMPLLAVFSPRFLAAGPGVIGLVFFCLYPFVFGKKWPVSRPVFVIAGGLLALAGASALWAIDPALAGERALKLAGVILPGACLVSVALSLPGETLRRGLWMFPAALALAIVLLNIDYLSGFSLYRVTRGVAEGQKIMPHVLNRSAVSCAVLLFPAMVAAFIAVGRRRVWLAVGFIVLFLPVLVLTDSQSTLMAFAVALLFFLAFPYNRAVAWKGLALALVAGLVTAPWVAMWLFTHYAESLHHLPMMGPGGANAGNRLEIWDYISRYALQNPLYGFGIEATRAVTAFDTKQIYQQGVTILHPHNFTLQIWIEFGVVGVVLAAGFFIYILKEMREGLHDYNQKRAALPPLIALLCVGVTGYGLWQGWWLGLIFLTAALAIVVAKAKAASRT